MDCDYGAANTTNRWLWVSKPIRDLAENWNIDIAAELIKYTEEIHQLVYKHGPQKLNFAEAAMLIQGCACVYSRKVEYLYQLVRETVDFLQNRNEKAKKRKNQNAAGEGGAEDADDDEDDDEAFSQLDQLRASANITLKQTDGKDRKVQPAMPVALIPLEEFEKSDVPLLSRVGEVVGKKDDFRINSSLVHPSGALLLDWHNAPLIGVNEESLTRTIQHVPLSQPTTSTQQTNPPVEPESFGMDDDVPGADDDDVDMTLEAPAPVVEEEEVRESVSIGVAARQRPPKPRARIVDADQVPKQQVQKEIKDPFAILDPYEDDGRRKPKRVGNPKDPGKLAKPAEPRKRKADGELVAPKSPKPISNYIKDNFFMQNKQGTKLTELPPALEDVALIEVKRRQQVDKQMRAQGERFGGQMDDVEEEADAESSDNEADGDDDVASMPGDDGPPELEDDDLIAPPLPDMPVEDVEMQPAPFEPQRPPSQMSYEEMVNVHLERMTTAAAEYMCTNDLSRRVQMWEDKIMPVLKEEETRRKFDIHEYGTDILNKFSEVGECKTFAEVLNPGCSRWESCRYFLSSLMLANTYNVRVGHDKDNVVNSMHMTFLKRERHHEQFEAVAE